MAKNKKSGRNRRRRRATASTNKPSGDASSNFVDSAGPGCYIARRDVPNDWILEWEDVDPTDFDGQDVPDIALDPEDYTVTLCNISCATKVAYVTIYDEVTVRGASNKILTKGKTVNDDGQERPCLTFILLCPPRTFAHLSKIELPENDKNLMEHVSIDSDVQEWTPHPCPNEQHDEPVGFPLQGGPFLCTQGEGGHLTHFFSGNLHAIDFRCPIGTPLLAVGDGVVVDVKTKHTALTGIAVSNLFHYNSILLKLSDDFFVEYVHIASASVKVGDAVTKGQVIGASGSVGFSPEPHLHFSAYKSSEPTAPTVRVRFESSNSDDMFLPVAGKWYNDTGLVSQEDE